LKNLIEGLGKFGKPLDVAIGWKKKMEEAGFEDVTEKILKVGGST